MERIRELAARWGVAALWLSLPFTVGTALADALAGRSETAQRVDSVGLWLVWAAGLVAALVASTVSLTAVRVLGPAVFAGAVAAVLGGARGPGAVVAVATGVIVAAATLNGDVADRFVNGSSYGDERRFLLRAPAPLVLGPLPVAWLAMVAGAVAGPLLLGAGAWIAGGVALALGWPVVALLARSMHGLSRRWLVFVPVGLVVHDYTALVDSLLLPRKDVVGLRWAEAGTDALDLSANAPGRLVEVDLGDTAAVLPRPPRRPGSPGPAVESVDASAFLVAPARGAAALAEAERRGLRSERTP